MLEFGREFHQIVYDMPFQISQDLILLGRTVAILSDMCTGLHTQFNLWENMAPFAQAVIFDVGDIQSTKSGWQL